MKKNLKLIATILSVLLIVTLCAFTISCGDDGGEGGKIKLIFTDETGNTVLETEISTEAEYLAEVIDELNAGNLVSVDVSGGAYGKVINSYSIGGIAYGDWNGGKYVMTYTSIDDIQYISVYDGSTKTINGVSYNACGLGIDQMPVKDGEVYLFTVESF